MFRAAILTSYSSANRTPHRCTNAFRIAINSIHSGCLEHRHRTLEPNQRNDRCGICFYATDASGFLSDSDSDGGRRLTFRNSEENITTSNTQRRNRGKSKRKISTQNSQIDWGTETTRTDRRRDDRVNIAKRKDSAINTGKTNSRTRTTSNKPPRKSDLLLPRATEHMASFLRIRESLPPPPATWLLHDDSGTSKSTSLSEDAAILEQRTKLQNDVVRLLLIIRDSVNGGHLSARGGKNSLILSDLLGNVLLLLGESPPSHLLVNNASPDNSESSDVKMSSADAASVAFDLLRKMNLDIRPQHYASAVRAACHDGRWDMASSWFSLQVDPDSAGLVPVDATLGYDGAIETGLYAIARQSQLEHHTQGDGLYVARKVFDAALSMSIISPTDQDNYVLAAGFALGRAGEWKGLAEYIKTDDILERLGNVLVAAAMVACVECAQYDAALEIYNCSVSNPTLGGSEWQWGGGYDIIHPLARDVTFRAMGRSSEEGWGEQAIKIFRNQIIKEGNAISQDALRGLFMTFEREGQWRYALDVLNLLLSTEKSHSEDIWRVVSDSKGVLRSSKSKDEPIPATTPSFYVDYLDGNMLASIMSTCNTSNEYGLALLCEMLVIGTEQTPVPSASHLRTNSSERVLLSKMVSLCGLGCYDEALDIYENVAADVGGYDYACLSDCASYAEREMQFLDNVKHQQSQAWRATLRHMERILQATHLIVEKRKKITPEECSVIAGAVGRLMQCCNDARQPRVGIALAEHVFGEMGRVGNKETQSIGSSLRSFFGFDQDENREHDQDQAMRSIMMECLSFSDLLLSATMNSYNMLNMSKKAIDLFFQTMEDASASESRNSAVVDSCQFVESWNDAIKLLFLEGRDEEATNMFHALEDHLRTPNTFIAVAKGYSSLGKWSSVGETYSQAIKAHCLSEDIALLAMRAIVEQEMDGKVPTLRAIVDDMAKVEGCSSSEWIKSRYWKLKRQLGWRFARLLMWWNDHDTASEDEFLLAIEQLESTKRDGNIPKNDALRCIVKYASLRMPMKDDPSGTADDAGAVDRSQVVELLLEVVLEAKRTSLIRQPAFITITACGFRAVRANSECIQFVRDSLSEGCRVNKKALLEALYAAEDIGDKDAAEEMSAALDDVSAS